MNKAWTCVVVTAAALTAVACGPQQPGFDPSEPGFDVSGRHAQPTTGTVPAPQLPARAATIDRVIDGDTVALTGGERVRLLTIDAAELNTRTKADDAECGAVAARDALAGLLPPGTRVDLAGLPGEPNKDRYGRTLANAYVTVSGAPVNVSLWLVGNGWAEAYLAYRTAETGRAVDLQRQAQGQRVGMWRTCPAGTR